MYVVMSLMSALFKFLLPIDYVFFWNGILLTYNCSVAGRIDSNRPTMHCAPLS